MNNQDSELFELCKSVYDDLEWQIEDSDWVVGDENGDLFILTKKIEEEGHFDYYTPLYTSDYLLEKLPAHIKSKEYPGEFAKLWTRKDDHPEDDVPSETTYLAWYFVTGKVDGVSDFGDSANTPLKALLKLTIELSKQGLLK